MLFSASALGGLIPSPELHDAVLAMLVVVQEW